MQRKLSGILSFLYLLLQAGAVYCQDTALIPAARITDSLMVHSLCQSADAYLQEGRTDEAKQSAEAALALSDRLDYRKGRAEAFLLLGRVAEKDNDPPLALRNYFTAVREYEWTGDLEKLSEVFGRMGDIYRSGGIYLKAVEYYGRAARSAGNLISPNEKAIIDEKLAETYFLMAEYDSALVIYRILFDFYRADKPPLAISTLMQITSCLYEMERFEEALAYNETALEISRSGQVDPVEEIIALNSLGYNFQYLKDHKQAEDYFNEAVDLASERFPGEVIYPVTLVNLAIAVQNDGDIPRSLEIFLKALKVAEMQENTAEQARICHLISYVYYLRGDFYNAGSFNQRAINLAIQSKGQGLLQNAYLVASMIRTSLYDYEEGMIYYQKYLSLRDSLATAAGLEQQHLTEQEYAVERTEKELSQILYDRELQNMEVKNLRIEGEKKQQELELLRRTADLQNATILNQELEKSRTLQELLLAEEKLAAEKKDREIIDLKLTQQLQESELRRNELEQIRQQQEIQVLTKDKELNELTIQKIRARNIFLAGIVLLSLVILALVIRGLVYARKTNKVLHDQRNKIQQQKEAIESQYELIREEQEKSERLLLNILPVETAAELKEKGRAIPRQYRKVSVLFTDFVGFTKVAEKMTPEELIGELDACFMEFDRIIGNHNLEKIKTIGDSYMCAGGIPVENDTNPQDAVAAALEIKEFMDRTREERNKGGKQYWEIRTGIHTGEVVAGVVGKKKFAYDIWGDAVNTASRMESSGEPGKVNISGSTYELVKEHFICSHRGKIYAKNKGEIDMYFVEGRKG